jgi:ATP/maltotriose-dependent transcriptional regulator MalT
MALGYRSKVDLTCASVALAIEQPLCRSGGTPLTSGSWYVWRRTMYVGGPMSTTEALQRGRESFGQRAWKDAFAQLSAADREARLGPEDLERFAVAAHLVGQYDDSATAWERAHHESLNRGDAPRAARCAFWLAFSLINRGELARASGWLARAQRLLDDGGYDCVERGYLLMPVGVQRLAAGDAAAAYATFEHVIQISDRFRDPDLRGMGQVGRGRTLINLGRVAEGVVLLDEVMVGVTSGEISPFIVGDVYCGIIEACQEIHDLRRAHEWTAALTEWCASQPDLVPYRGKCLVYRAEIMQLHGAWPNALDEARRACTWLSHPSDQHVAALAYYQLAELHRLRGAFSQAEEAYRQANQFGRTPQPGLALLRLAQGQVDAAEAAIRRLEHEPHDRVTRPRVLAALVEIMLAAGDVPAARAAADELSAMAADLDALFPGAVAAYSQGAVLLAEGDAAAALAALRHAWAAWQELDAPYEAARARVLIGLACRELRDHDSAAMELDAARRVFRQLGAGPDLARVESLSRKTAPRAAGGLTAREVEVLRLVAAGKTNRAIAAELFLSEKTVDRHVSNIFTKLGLSSRAAATAYAYEHRLV